MSSSSISKTLDKKSEEKDRLDTLVRLEFAKSFEVSNPLRAFMLYDREYKKGNKQSITGFLRLHADSIAFLKSFKTKKQEAKKTFSEEKSLAFNLLAFLKEANYPLTATGACFGVAMKAIECYLCEERKLIPFDERIMRMPTIDLKTEEKLSEEEREKQIDIFAFCDGIALYAQPENFSSELGGVTFQSDIKTIAPMTESIALKNARGLNLAGSFINAYTDPELECFCHFLTEYCKKNLTHKIAFEISSGNHSISLCFDPADPSWTLVDAETLPSKRVAPADLAKTIRHHLYTQFGWSTDVSLFSSSIYSTGLNKLSAEHFNRNLQASVEFKEIHDFTSVDVQDGNGFSLAYLAAQQNDMTPLKKLIEAKANLDIPESTNGWTPLWGALHNNHLEAFQLLIDAKANINARNKEGKSLIFEANFYNKTEMVERLLKAGALSNSLPEELQDILIYLMSKTTHERLNNALLEVLGSFNRFERATQEILVHQIMSTCNKLKTASNPVAEDKVIDDYLEEKNKVLFPPDEPPTMRMS